MTRAFIRFLNLQTCIDEADASDIPPVPYAKRE